MSQEAFLCDAVRTPIGKFGGSLASVRPDDLAAHVIHCLLGKNTNLDVERLDEVFLGCANQSGEDNRNVARMALLLAGLPATVPGMTINRLCASGMDAVAAAARAVRSGEIELAIAGGVESMTRAPFVMGKAEAAFARSSEIFDTTIGWRFINSRMRETYGVDSMPETAENVAVEQHISRDDQDAFAWRSQQRAGAAKQAGFFVEEIVPLTLQLRKGAVTIENDEHIRAETTLALLAGLKPLQAGGTVTAGNASGINDGAAAMIIASESMTARGTLRPRARILGMASAGVEPRVMGLGPVPAVQKLLDKLKLSIQDFDVIELNEAFASQALASLRLLGLPDDAEHVNPNGGAIALGHPLGMSGSRLVMTAVHQLERSRGKLALAAMCVGVGQGVAIALERL
jgi:3-oxoadipyl-CoA thiolase